MPLVASVVLSTLRRFRDLIFAPDESSNRLTFFWMPVTSRPFSGITLSLLFTVQKISRNISQNMNYGP